jgi:hypothetical protein
VSSDAHSPTDAGPPPVIPFPAATVPPPAHASPAERPEVQVGAAFAGGVLAALILKRLGD